MPLKRDRVKVCIFCTTGLLTCLSTSISRLENSYSEKLNKENQIRENISMYLIHYKPLRVYKKHPLFYLLTEKSVIIQTAMNQEYLILKNKNIAENQHTFEEMIQFE